MKIYGAIQRIRGVFTSRRLEVEMAEEMRGHLEGLAERHRAAGLSPEEAHYAALRQFGGVGQIQEECREQRRWIWLEQFGQDFRYAWRSLAKSRGFTAVAALTLAVGIGMTTSIFSVVYGVLLEPYPYAKSAEIWAADVIDLKSRRQSGFSVAEYLEIAKLPAVATAMATANGMVTLSGGINPEIVASPRVTGTAFDFLGVRPILGRGLGPSDFEANGEPRAVTVLSFKLWQRLFNGDPTALGKTVILDDIPHVIVGVMPPRFGWYTSDGLWRLLPTGDLKQWVRPIVRLKANNTPEVASQQLLGLIKEQARQDPDRYPKEGFTARFNNYLDITVASGDMRSSLILLLCAVGFLLLIVCTNVANLQLARGVSRGREMSVRLALGAGRGRLFRQLMTESVALSLAGGALGVLFAFGLLKIIVLLLPEHYVPNESRITLNGWVLAFSGGLAVLTGVLSGLVPGWQCTRRDVNESLKDGGHGAGAGSHRGNRTRNALVVVEVALSVILLIGASLSVRGFLKLQSVDRGFHTQSMLLLNIPLNPKRYTEFTPRNALIGDFLERVRALPGVAHATIGLPPGIEGRSRVVIFGQPDPGDALAINFIDAEYLVTLGIALKQGRNLTEQDIVRGEHVVLISEATAKLWLNGEDPIGRTLEVDTLIGSGPNNLAPTDATKGVTVVGIVTETRTLGPLRPTPPVVFLPYTLRAPANRAIMVRTKVEPSSLVNAVRTELRSLDKEQPMHRPITFEEIIDEQNTQPRFNLAMLGMLAGIALVLAAAGIYSVLSYGVAQRTREIGLRMALGAERGDVLRLFFGLGSRLLGVGLLVGLGASVALTQVVTSKVFNGPVLDPIAFVIAILFLSAATLLACYVPALRATKVDPMVALRMD